MEKTLREMKRRDMTRRRYLSKGESRADDGVHAMEQPLFISHDLHVDFGDHCCIVPLKSRREIKDVHWRRVIIKSWTAAVSSMP